MSKILQPIRRPLALSRPISTTSSKSVIGGAVSALLHGSPEAREEGDIQIEQHSKLVGRGVSRDPFALLCCDVLEVATRVVAGR